MSLILKQEHWKLTVLSTLFVLPAFLTAVAGIVARIFGFQTARSAVNLLLSLPSYMLGVAWLLLPLIAVYLAHQAYERGTIDRWRPINKAVKNTGILLLVAALVVSGLFAF